MSQRFFRAVHTAPHRALAVCENDVFVAAASQFQVDAVGCSCLTEQLESYEREGLYQLGRLSEILLVRSLEVLDPSVVEGPNPRRDFLDDIMIVRHQNQGTWEPLKSNIQGVDGFQIQMVRRFIQDQ